MIQDKAWSAENGQPFSKDRNAGLDHLGSSLWATLGALAR